MSDGLLSATHRGHLRVALIATGLVAIFTGMLWAYDFAGVPHITRPYEYCPDMEISCPGNKWSMEPLSYAIFFGGYGVAMAWTAVTVVVMDDA